MLYRYQIGTFSHSVVQTNLEHRTGHLVVRFYFSNLAELISADSRAIGLEQYDLSDIVLLVLESIVDLLVYSDMKFMKTSLIFELRSHSHSRDDQLHLSHYPTTVCSELTQSSDDRCENG